MTPQEFVTRFYPDAQISERTTGISAIATLAQAALESAWGKVAPGNMFFGEKDTDGLNGNEQLLTTTEYLRRPDAKFPVIISVTPVIRNGQKYYKYLVKDYFRKFSTPAECFTAHAQFFLNNPRYRSALSFKTSPERFVEEIAKAGYATDPNYSNSLKAVISTIKRYI